MCSTPRARQSLYALRPVEAPDERYLELLRRASRRADRQARQQARQGQRRPARRPPLAAPSRASAPTAGTKAQTGIVARVRSLLMYPVADLFRGA